MKSVFVVFAFYFLLVGISACRVKNSPPELTTISPQPAYYAGQTITLGGYQFGTQPTVTFSTTGVVAMGNVVSASDDRIQVVIPLVPPGLSQIRVQTGEGVSDPLPLMVLQPPPVAQSPIPGNGLPGSLVVVPGSFLNQILGVRFGQIPAVIQDSSANKLTLVVPSNFPHGPTTIVIDTKGGVATAGFIVAGTPQITGLSTKKAKPGTELVVQGINLIDGVVRINGLPTNGSQTTVKDTEIRTIIPDNATSGKVTVSVFEKLIATSADSLQIVLKPAIASLGARDGVTGDKLILNGLNLRDVSSVTIGNTAVSFRVLSDTQLEATVPAFPTSGQLAVSVASVGGNATATDPFFYYLAASNLTVSPARQLRGRPITISGQNLYRITDVRISGQSVPITSRNEGTDLLVNVPANAVSGPVIVVSRAGTVTSSQSLVVIQKPVITAIIPAKARPGERVVLQGNFLLDAQFQFTGSAGPAPEGGKNDDTEHWILVPSDAQNGPIQVSNASGEVTNTESFTVVRLATITDFSPKTAAVGAEITITGQNLASVTAVRFNGGTSAPAVFRLSGSSLIVTVPAGAVTGQICLTNDAGSACTTANFSPAK